ncbi:MAG TPA: ABC transporter substrate-binding protein [Gaiellaceae bacterium]|nr:ABC transporter substrate-binding protein [Gaiellaceae bacterium]
MLRSLAAAAGTLFAALALALPGAAGTGPQATAGPAAAGRFPVTITTPAGTVTVRAKPRRIVSLSPTATETLFAIGAGPQVVAVDDQSDYPRQAPRTALSGFTPNVEAIASYRPDLVVAAYDPKGLSQALRRLGVPVVIHGAPATFAGAYQQIRQLGLVTGNERGARTLIARMKARIGRIVGAFRARARGLSVYHEVSPDLYSASSRSFVGKVYAAFGLRNIADAADTAGTGFPQLSSEYVIAADPDVIVLADTVCCGQTPSTVAARPGWDRISAVRTGSIVRIHDSIASRWGPRLVSFFRAVAAALQRLRP